MNSIAPIPSQSINPKYPERINGTTMRTPIKKRAGNVYRNIIHLLDITLFITINPIVFFDKTQVFYHTFNCLNICKERKVLTQIQDMSFSYELDRSEEHTSELQSRFDL